MSKRGADGGASAAKKLKGPATSVNVLMVGTGEYTTGYVGGKAADSDKVRHCHRARPALGRLAPRSHFPPPSSAPRPPARMPPRRPGAASAAQPSSLHPLSRGWGRGLGWSGS